MTHPADGDGFDELLDGAHRATGTAAMRGIEHMARSRQDAAYRDRAAEEQATRAALARARAEAGYRATRGSTAQVSAMEVERWLSRTDPDSYERLRREYVSADTADGRASVNNEMRRLYDEAHRPPAGAGVGAPPEPGPTIQEVKSWLAANRPEDARRLDMDEMGADHRDDWKKINDERRRLYDEAHQQQDLAVIERRESEEARRIAGLPEVGTDRPTVSSLASGDQAPRAIDDGEVAAWLRANRPDDAQWILDQYKAVQQSDRDVSDERGPGQRDQSRDRTADRLWDSHDARLERAQRLRDAAGAEPDVDAIQAAMMADLAFGTAPQASVAPKDPKAPRRAAPAKTRRRAPRTDRQRDQGLTR